MRRWASSRAGSVASVCCQCANEASSHQFSRRGIAFRWMPLLRNVRSAALLLGSYFVCAGQFETISVQLFGFRSMNTLYSPGATVLLLMTSGTSVFSRVVTFAPARHTGAPAYSFLP